jgi:hypothetical protein
MFSRFPWELLEASNHFNDDFLVLRATVGLEQYEQARVFSTSREHGSAFRQIAATISEIGPHVRFIAVELDPDPKQQPVDARGLTAKEINKLVYKYI